MDALLFVVLDTDSQTAAVSAVWGVGVAFTVALVVGVCWRMRKLHKQRTAREASRRKAQLRAAGLQAIPAAADEEWQRIIAALNRRDHR